jgi:hypothetical protein
MEDRPIEVGGLIRLAYVSEATVTFSDAALRELLTQARANNASLDVTGMLLFIDRSFFQILEGDAETVHRLFAKIGRAKRHGHLVKLIEEPIEQRDFGDWSMGMAKVSSKELRSLPGFSDILAGGGSLQAIGSARARVLLSAFRDGRWRARVAA